MPYSNPIFIRIGSRANYICEMCGKDVSKVPKGQHTASFAGHSIYTLHLAMLDSDASKCIVTSAPTRLSQMRGKILPVRGFPVISLDRRDDGFCLCHSCHAGIHSIALEETKLVIPNYIGRNSAPAVLGEVSLYFINRGRF